MVTAGSTNDKSTSNGHLPTKSTMANNNNNENNNKSSATKTAGLTASGKPKEKRRNNEKRKEKSRDAARCRRSRETEIFSELAEVLPLKKEDVNQLDKASIMRIAIAYLKIREMLQLFPNIKALNDESTASDESEQSETKTINDDVENKDKKFDLLKCSESGYLLKQTLNGFLLILSNEGDITYVSENVCEYLGIAKIDILGQPIWEYIHQCDHAELKDALNLKRNGILDKVKDENMQEHGLTTHHRDLFIRFKCTLTSRGRSINIKSASYKVIHLGGHLVVNAKGDQVFISIGSPIPHPSNIEIPLGTTTFLTKHSLDMKFTYVDDKMYNLLNYNPEDLLQTSLYNCHHGCDSDSLLATFKSVLSKGQGETSRYRFLGKYGGYCWLVTQATIVYDKLKPQSVVCVNYVVSQLENNNEIYSLSQYEESNKKLLDIDNKTIPKITNSITIDIDNNNTNNNSDSNSSNNVVSCSPSNNNNNNNHINNKNIDEIKQTTSSVFNQLSVDKEQQQQQQQQQDDLLKSPKDLKTVITSIDNNVITIDANINNTNKINKKLNNYLLIENKENKTIEKKDSIDIKKEPLSAATAAIAVAPTIATTTKTATKESSSSTSILTPSSLSSSSASTTTKTVTGIGTETEIETETENLVSIPTTTTTLSVATSVRKVYKPIVASPKTVTSKIIQQQNQQVQQQQLKRCSNLIEKHPKSVTASVFKIAPTPTTASTTTAPATTTVLQQSLFSNTIITNKNNICNINPNTNFNPLLLPSINTTKTNTAAILSLSNFAINSSSTKAQSVTASVLTPLSQLSNKNSPLLSGPITTTTSTAAILAHQHQQQQQQQQSINSNTNTNRQNLINTINHNLAEGGQRLKKQQAMNKGFLSFAEDVSESTMLKEEPDDLSHMTSASVDACLPLDETSPLFSEMLGLMGSYSTLLPDDINSLDSTSYSSATDVALSSNSCNNNNNNKHTNNFNKNLLNNNGSSITSNGCNMDPFITYREESNDTNCSQHLLSPSVASKSPEESSLPSLCSPHSLSQEEDYALMTMNVDDDIDLAMRAPYIPMDERDDLPLLTNDNKDIMWPDGSTAFTVEELNLHKDADTLHELSLHHLQQQHQQHNSFYSHHQDQHFSNSLCSSPASSTISSLSPASPLQLQHQQQQQHHQLNSNVFCTDSSELAALLGGTGNGTLSILNSNNNCNSNGSGNNNDGNNSIGGIVNNIVENSQQNQQQQESHSFRLHDLQELNDLQEQQQQQQQQNQQHQQQQNHLINLNINCKKEKYDNNNSLASSLCDSMDDPFENVYSKDSSNVDWSEFLQLNVTDPNTNSPTSLEDCKHQMQHFQQLLATSQNDGCQPNQNLQQQQNIIINAVPLITIQQNNKNILLQQNSIGNNGNSAKMLINEDLMLPTNDFITSVKSLNNNNSNNNNNNSSGNNRNTNNSNTNNNNSNSNKLSTIKLLNGSTAAITPLTTKATIRLIENKMPSQQTQIQQIGLLNNKTANVLQNTTLQQQQQQSQAPQQHASKRHLSSLSAATTQVESKRLKCNELTSAGTTTTPQLLQQLVNGHNIIKDLNEGQKQHQQQQQQQLQQNAIQKTKNQKGSNQNIKPSIQLQVQQKQTQQQQQSNSVLKNLLISGCDKPMKEALELMVVDSNPLDVGPTCVTSSLIKPLHCVTGNVLRSESHNPMIGGPGLLLSPPFHIIHNDDSNPPGLSPCDIDSASDSGIDENSLNESIVTVSSKRKNLQSSEIVMKVFDEKINKHVNKVPPAPVTPAPPPPDNLNNSLPDSNGSSRKSSISFMDSSNPLLTPWMDLCDDDYNMATVTFLQDELEQVLGDWPSDIA